MIRRARTTTLAWLLTLALGAAGATCGGSGGDADVDADADTDTDADTDADADADADTDTDTDTDTNTGWPPLAPIEAWQDARQVEYLERTCAEPLNPRSVTHLHMHLECEARGIGGVTVPENVVPDDAWDGIFLKLWRLRDTSDFDLNRLMNLLHAFDGHPAVSAALWQKLKDAILDFKYWFTDPTPAREYEGEPVIDMMWYWSENHIMIFHVNEYLAGQKYPDEIFRTTGMTGAEHRARARAWMLTWLEERARWGFTEWHSNVYYNWDMQPLLSLVEFADDPELATRAAMVLDLVWLDVALHHHRGTFGATHGRSYIKDKPAADREDVFASSKLMFDDTALDYNGLGGNSFARVREYALPHVIRTIARDDTPMVDKERMNVPLDIVPPERWDDPVTPAPYGLSYTDAEHLPLWWSMSAFMAWPLLPTMLETASRYSLWEGQFKDFAFVLDLIGPIEDPEDQIKAIHPIYKTVWKVIMQAILEQVNTYTYRTAHYMLSTNQDYHPGISSNQAHTWQATLSEHALVFVTHPAYLPVPEDEPVPEDWNWQREDEPGPGYWTGDGARPRAAQFENVGVYLYAPQYKARPFGLSQFDYREETHAYFPVAHFDAVVQEGGWTFGKKDDGFVALYSLLPTQWRQGQPEVYANQGLDFDLVAAGSAQNVWIVELGSPDDGYADFAAFRAAILAASVEATPVADQDDDGLDDGYDVAYDSPSQGLVTFGWHQPLVVAGQEIPLAGYKRHDNPFVQTEFDDTRYEVVHGAERLLLDFATDTREATAAP